MAKQRGGQSSTATRDRRRGRGKGVPGGGRRKSCPFCRDKVDIVDYKDFGRLRRAISEKGKIRSSRVTGAAAATSPNSRGRSSARASWAFCRTSRR